ncbi:MAG: Flp pilus assembly protein CpaB [Planctomycetia bacterium]|nr:Flp pilus assembly protein CpaB [Planctomycetia bacterium]
MTSASPATVFLGICAIFLGLLSAYGVRVALSQEDTVAPPPAKVVAQANPVPMKKMIMAKNNIPPYAVIKAEHLIAINLPVADYPQDGISREEVLLGRVTSRIITAGRAITEKDVFELGKVPTLQEKLRPGETAMTIPVSMTSSVAGYLYPDAYVNISLTVTGAKHSKLKDLTTVTLLKNVRVLATSENLFPYNPGVSRDISNITVAVSPEVANKLTVAQNYGKLGVTLANPADAEGGLQDAGPQESISPLELLGLTEEDAVLAPEVPVAKADMWYSTSRRELRFNSDEVKESRAATMGENDASDELEPENSLQLNTPLVMPSAPNQKSLLMKL